MSVIRICVTVTDQTLLSLNLTSTAMKINAETDAILCIDVQNDFLPGGSLAAPLGDKIVEPTIAFLKKIKAATGLTVVATRDWHPANHSSFKSYGGPWPVHCVQGSHGAEFPSGFPIDLIDIDIRKGTVVDKEAYSGFEGTDLAEQLSKRGIKRAFVFGLTTEYCVFSSARDAKNNGLETFVIDDLIAEVVPKDKQTKIDEMKAQSIHIVQLKDLEY